MTIFPGPMLPLPARNEGTCFGCGPRNDAGLRMRFFSDGTLVAAELTVPEHLCGWGNVVHGGIVSTILDEVMGWSGIWLLRRLVLTKNMSVEFLKPIMAGEKIRAEGSVVEVRGERHAVMKAKLCNGEGEVCARANGVFALFTREAAEKLGFLDLSLVNEIADTYLT